ncbi:MAG: hypothetical protein PHO26_04525 [Dehalococcoidia bacterium]|nr:hypothetical protein [Dehalococcoidia bacterium]MDD5493319.1 hypothetical protein [Dehalococcoidia bacterium]
MRRALRSLLLIVPLLTLASLLSFLPCTAAAPVGVQPAEFDQTDPILKSGVYLTDFEVFPQPESIGLTLNLPRRSFLTGENIQVVVSTNTSSTAMTLYYEINGERTTLTGSTISGSQSFSIKAPADPGPVRLICEGSAIVIYWDTCIIYQICGYDTNNLPRYCPYTYQCQKETMVYGTASTDFVVYGRHTSISGNVYDLRKNPVNQARVELSNGESRTTSSDGFYEFADFTLGDNYRLAGERPTVDITMKIDAVACRQQVNSISVSAEQPRTGVNINLDRVFYPPEINLANFTFSAFSGWPAASTVSTWEDIIAITSTGTARMSNINYGGSGLATTPVEFKAFTLGDKNLYLIPDPRMGRYRLDLLIEPPGAFNLYAAAKIPGIGQLQEVNVTGKGDKPGEKFFMDINTGAQSGPGCAPPQKLELEPIEVMDTTSVILIAVAGVLAGLLVSFFFLNRKYGWTDRNKKAAKGLSLKQTVTAAHKPLAGEQDGVGTKLDEPGAVKQIGEGKPED